MYSFDIVSEPDMHEVRNAFEQTLRELSQRYDFRGTDSQITQNDTGFELTSNSEERVNAIWDVLSEKFIKRKLSLKFLEKQAVTPIGGAKYKLCVLLKKGIPKDQAKELSQIIKAEKNLKVTPSIQGECVRVSGKKKDDLQQVMTLIKEKEFSLAISFENFRG